MMKMYSCYSQMYLYTILRCLYFTVPCFDSDSDVYLWLVWYCTQLVMDCVTC